MLNQETNIPLSTLENAFLIREVEQRFLSLFSEGKLNGTVHTCVGQEFSALAFAGQLESGDSVFSNHRCHGHFLAFTGDHNGLVAELMGKETGVCGGIGGSQHLYKDGFFSNGVQGGITPLAAGLAWARMKEGQRSITVVYIGDGTLGEGVVYESMNLASILKVPLLFVCENNGMAQSTTTEVTLAGDISKRADAFGIRNWSGTTDDPAALLLDGRRAISWVRENKMPGFFHVRTARLNPHSKGDDHRTQDEVEMLRSRDYLCQLERSNTELAETVKKRAVEMVNDAVAKAESSTHQSLEAYLSLSRPRTKPAIPVPVKDTSERLVKRLNQFFHDSMESCGKMVLIGEDVMDPYGGAFKVTLGLSTKYPDRVLQMPISEAGLSGFSNGMALAGWRPWAEIMFGDFITLAFDQIVNHASKFHHMYNGQVTCPVVFRTAVGGGRGYGPTHSQSLDKFICGIDNFKVIALNSWLDPYAMLSPLLSSDHPALVVEHKLDYGRRVGIPEIAGHFAVISDGAFPSITLRPSHEQATFTIVTYGGLAPLIADAIAEVTLETGRLAEIVVLGQISPLDISPIFESVSRTSRLITVEEGGTPFGIGAEILASVSESGIPLRWARRIGAAPIPIPSPPVLESQCIPTRENIKSSLLQILK